jgi:hypothetical protein
LSNHFVLLPYRLFGFSGYGIPEPPFAQLVVVLLLITPCIVTTLILAYLLRSYQARRFIIAIVLANICTIFLQILLFSDPNNITNIINQKGYFMQLFLPLAPFLVLLAVFARWSLTRKLSS